MNFLCISIFKGIEEDEFNEMLDCLCMRECGYSKGSVIFHAGDIIHEIGVACSGSIHIESTDILGNRSIISNIERGQIFAETYALCAEPMLVDAVAAEETSVLFINLRKLLSERNHRKTWYPKLLQNLLLMSAQKNMTLSRRILCTTSKTVRGRLLTYLSAQAVNNGSNEFTVPFNRQQMADYLNLDRSALSKELSRMRDEGILVFHKNHFKLIDIND